MIINSGSIGLFFCGQKCGESVLYTLRVLGPQALSCRYRQRFLSKPGSGGHSDSCLHRAFV